LNDILRSSSVKTDFFDDQIGWMKNQRR